MSFCVVSLDYPVFMDIYQRRIYIVKGERKVTWHGCQHGSNLSKLNPLHTEILSITS